MPLEDEMEIIRVGKDEVNLVEYPFAALSTKPSAGFVIEHEWETRHPITNRAVRARWRVAGDPELGLPNTTDERVYLVLMELTREAGLAQEINFKRYDIFKRLGWPPTKNYYEILQNSFARLKGVVITSQNAFWNPEARSFVTVGFNLIDNYSILSDKPGRKSKSSSELPLSSFRWNDVIHDSLKNGYIRSIDLNFALSLKLPLALRLYRYLDKKTHDGKGRFEIELHRLCELHLGMTPTKHNSTLKVRLKSAHEELVERGFLRSVEYAAMRTKGREGEKVCYVLGRRTVIEPSAPTEIRKLETPPSEQINVENKQEDPILTQKQLQELIALGIDENTARELLEQYSEDQISLQLHCLGERKPRDPAALFLYCLRKNAAPPASYLQKKEKYQRQEAEKAADEEARMRAAVAASETRRQRQEIEQAHTSARHFYETLSDRAKTLARQRVEIELGEAGRLLKIRYPHPQWLTVLHEVLQTPHFREQLESEQPPETSENSGGAKAGSAIEQSKQTVADLAPYVQTLAELLSSGIVNKTDIDGCRSKYFHRLNDGDWTKVKQQLLD